MNYWLHRTSYEGGYEELNSKNILTIGFSDIADEETLTAFSNEDWEKFNDIYCGNYPTYLRGRSNLWRFAVEMKIGDIVIVPYPGSFKICKITGSLELYPGRNHCDLGWQRKVEVLAAAPSREGFCSAALLSRMKTLWTNANIQDLQKDVDDALNRIHAKMPFNLSSVLAEECAKIIRQNGSPAAFENLVKQYFLACGADAQILPKNSPEKQGDCDIEAVFPSLNLVISVQAKFHEGQTDDWSVYQITEYANAQERDPNMIYWQWVITSAEGFSEEAKKQAGENNVRLITGVEFAQMLVERGITSLN